MPWGAVASIGAGLGGALIGGHYADKASQRQAEATDRATEETKRQYDQTRSDLEPYRNAGTAALSRLRALLGIDTGSPETSPLLRRFNAEDLSSDPVYNSGLQFGLDEGTKAIERRAAAGGGYDSGATLKALTRFGNDYGTTKAADAYSRFKADQGDIYGRLSGITGLGSGATNVGVNAGTTAASNLASLYSGQGNAAAASELAKGNLLAGGLNNAANYYGQTQLLRQLQGGGARSSGLDPNLVGQSSGTYGDTY